MQHAQTIDVKTLGVKGDGATNDSAAIDAALRRQPNASLSFPAGTYILDNLSRPGMRIDGFRGSITFAPGAKLVCTTATSQAQDCVNVQNAPGVILDGLHIAYQGGALPLDRAHPARRGMALRFWNVRGAKASNIQIDGSTGVGIFVDESQDCTFTNVRITNTSADGFSSVNSGNIVLTNLTTKTTMDDGLSIIRYEGKRDYTGFKASNIHISDSAARGITVPGETNVTITDFSVDHTCGQGVLVLRDGFYHTKTPDEVLISHGSISDAGHYTHPKNPCKLPPSVGIGLQYTDTGNVSVDSVTITHSAGPAIGGSQGPKGPASGNVVLSNIKVVGENGGGITIYNTKRLELSNISIEDANGGFFISNNGDVKTSNLTTKNVKGFLNRSFDFEKNNSVDATNSRIIDTKANPTGDGFVDTGNAQPSAFHGIKAEISNGKLQMKVSPTSKVTPTTTDVQ